MEEQDEFMPKSPFARKIYRYFTSGSSQFDRHQIKKWMKSDNLEVLGTVHSYVDDRSYSSKISPPFALKDFLELQKKYFSRCILENPEQPWVHNRAEAILDLIQWFYEFWNHPDITQGLLDDFNSWIAKLYKEGDKDVKDEIVHVVFLHLFEDKKVKKLFANWKDDPDLKEAYLKAVEMNP